MRIGIFTEGGFQGKISRDNPNMRTDLAWWCALDGTHHPLPTLHELPDNLYDFGIMILPKKKKTIIKLSIVRKLQKSL